MNEYVNPFGIHIRNSDNWGSYDNVGGSAKYSSILISADCPENKPVELSLEYWLPNKPFHIIKKGSILLHVTGKDHTPPIMRWLTISTDNVLQVRPNKPRAARYQIRCHVECS